MCLRELETILDKYTIDLVDNIDSRLNDSNSIISTFSISNPKKLSVCLFELRFSITVNSYDHVGTLPPFL